VIYICIYNRYVWHTFVPLVSSIIIRVGEVNDNENTAARGSATNVFVPDTFFAYEYDSPDTRTSLKEQKRISFEKTLDGDLNARVVTANIQDARVFP